MDRLLVHRLRILTALAIPRLHTLILMVEARARRIVTIMAMVVPQLDIITVMASLLVPRTATPIPSATPRQISTATIRIPAFGVGKIQAI